MVRNNNNAAAEDAMQTIENLYASLSDRNEIPAARRAALEAQLEAALAATTTTRPQVGVTFVTGGRALFTISNPTGTRYTYRINRKDEEGRQPVYFIGLLTGPNNEADYTYLGILDVVQGAVKLTKKSRYTDDTLPVKVIRWAVHQLWQGRDLPAGYSIHHEGRCGVCGRTLTTPESVETGIGPVCAGREM